MIIMFVSLVIGCNGGGGAGSDANEPPPTTTKSPRTGDDPRICGMCGYTTRMDVLTATNYTINNLPGGTYYFSLTTYDEDGIEGTFSNEMVQTFSSSPGSVTISWIARSEPEASGYKIYYGISK